MLNRVRIERLDDYFTDLGKRRSKGVYFYRINGYNQLIHDFILKYHEAARLSGVIIEGRLQNPDNKNLDYFNEIMGMDFRMDRNFIHDKLRKWLPRMTPVQCGNVADSIYDTLMSLRNSGKNDNMLKNAYIKFMCWLYYKFERIVHKLGNETLPKILYEGDISMYELLLMNVLSIAGCDIVLLQYAGDAEYLKADPDSSRSFDLRMNDMTAFPQGFCLKQIRQEMQDAAKNQRLYGDPPKSVNCTNAWITGKIFDDVRTDIRNRGSDDRFFYNCFARINGVEDKVTYSNDLFKLRQELKNNCRRIVVVSKIISPPEMDEISSINRKNYQKIEQLIPDLASNFGGIPDVELRKLVNKAFVDILLEESRQDGSNINRLTNKAVYLVCWFKRYQHDLFNGWKFPEISCFFYMGGCRNDNEAMFCRFLSKLPADVLIFNPNLNQKCCLEDRSLYEVNYSESLNITEYPDESSSMRAGTAAYHAERELDSMMYRDSGIYRNQQYEKANTITLRTMYEEIAILWDKELTYRPNFATVDDVVNMPVIFSKISGVKNGDLNAYWLGVKKLITPDTILIKNIPNISSAAHNPMKQYSVEFLHGGKLQRRKIREHNAYQYKFLREPMQEYLLDKLQTLIDSKLIRGTFENGTEYTIVATALNIDKDTLRLIQKFDFTKTNPKIIYIVTGETEFSVEDTIYFTFMNLIGFDVLFFVPTGYRCLENYLAKDIVEEHQIGEYKYDLGIPDFNTITESTRHKLRDRIFKRGK